MNADGRRFSEENSGAATICVHLRSSAVAFLSELGTSFRFEVAVPNERQ